MSLPSNTVPMNCRITKLFACRLFIVFFKGLIMNKKLYVGNISYATTEDELRSLFGEVGPVVSVTMITDRATGQSKGFGFVEMETNKAAQDAIDRFNNYEINQRKITVSEARPPREGGSFSKSSGDRGRNRSGGSPRGGSGGGGGGGRRRF
ncbi:MAG TPA: RNA-binding protein [Thermodesulfovibrionia bacterium]|nr:RNA-binding protein [Thermodesulfovibrionia bacterium]